MARATCLQCPRSAAAHTLHQERLLHQECMMDAQNRSSQQGRVCEVVLPDMHEVAYVWV